MDGVGGIYEPGARGEREIAAEAVIVAELDLAGIAERLAVEREACAGGGRVGGGVEPAVREADLAANIGAATELAAGVERRVAGGDPRQGGADPPLAARMSEGRARLAEALDDPLALTSELALEADAATFTAMLEDAFPSKSET